MSRVLQGRSVHVCFVAETIYPVLTNADIPFVGGAQVQQTILARELRVRGYRVSVLTGDHGVADSVTRDGIEIYHLPPRSDRGVKGLRFFYPGLTDVVRRLRQISPDVMYFQCAAAKLAGCAWYAKESGRKLIFAAASDADFFPPGRVFAVGRKDLWLYRYGLKRSHVIIVQNREQQLLLRERYGRNGVVIPNYYAERDYQAGSAQGPVIWVGTISRIKRPEVFLSLAKRFPDRRFVMVGGPAGMPPVHRTKAAMEFYRSIESQAKQLSNVEFVGYVPFNQVGRRFDGASALVNTSEFEGLPNVFLQAWIRGIPTLSFVAPTTADEPTGTIECSDLDDMCRRLALLVQGPGHWLDASARVRGHYHRCHSAEAVMPKYDDVFSQLLAMTGPNAG